MRVTRKQLKQIIQEELDTLSENVDEAKYKYTFSVTIQSTVPIDEEVPTGLKSLLSTAANQLTNNIASNLAVGKRVPVYYTEPKLEADPQNKREMERAEKKAARKGKRADRLRQRADNVENQQ